MAVDREFIKTLAEANGLSIPDDRLDVVLRQYESYLRAMEKIDTVEQEMELEPVIDFSVEDIGPGGPGGMMGRPPGGMPRREMSPQMMRRRMQQMRENRERR